MLTEPKGILKQLSSSDAECQFKAVRCLKNEIIGSSNRKQCYIQLGAVPRIVKILASPQEQRLAVQAAAALGSFAYENMDGVSAIVESGGVAHLLKALSNEDMKLVEAGVRSLKMIYQSPSPARELLFKHPAFDRLVLFLDFKEKSFAEDSLIIFAKCCQTRQHQDLMLESGVLPKMIKLLLSPVSSIQFAAIEALDKFSYDNDAVRETLIKSEEVMKTLMRFLRGRNIRVQFAACSLLASFSREMNPPVPPNSWFATEVAEVLVSLIDEPSVHLRVPRILADVIRGRRELQEMVYNSGGLRKLWKLIVEDNEIDQVHLLGIVRAIGAMCKDMPVCRKEILSSGTIYRLLEFMDTECLNLQLAACYCFESIVSHQFDKTVPLTPFSDDMPVRMQEYGCTALVVLLLDQDHPEAYFKEAMDRLSLAMVTFEQRVKYKVLWGLGELIKSIFKMQWETITTWMPILDQLSWNFVRGMLYSPSYEVQSEALNFLKSMCGEEDGIQTAIDWSNGELLPLIAYKLDTPRSTGEMATRLALEIAADVSKSKVEHQIAVMGSGIPPLLLGCLEERMPERVKLAAITCVRNLAYRDVLPLGQEDYRSAHCRAMALLELGIEESLRKLEAADGSSELKNHLKEAISFLGQLE